LACTLANIFTLSTRGEYLKMVRTSSYFLLVLTQLHAFVSGTNHAGSHDASYDYVGDQRV